MERIKTDDLSVEKYEVNYVDLYTGEKIAYRKAGDGDRTMVLVHGNLSSSVWFEELMEELSDQATLYAIDIAGCGDSSYNRISVSLREMSKDLTAFINVMDLEDVTLLGWSTGGGIALETAADIPNRIREVILLSSVGITGYPIFKSSIFMPFSHDLIRTREEMRIYNPMVSAVKSIYKSQNVFVVKGLSERMIYHKTIPEDELATKYAYGTLKQRNYVDILTAIVNFNMTNESVRGVEGSGRARLVKAPIYVIHGDSDIICDLSEAEKTAEYFGTRAELKIFRGCGHSIATDDFDGLVDYIRSIIGD